MPTYRRPHTIYRTVGMIQAQTYRSWQLIIIDKAGDDHILFDDARIRVYRHIERPSASYARNQGLQYATGDLVCFFDDDDDMFPTYLERFAAAFQTNRDAKMARCGMIV
jgi:glycosyltransferase involved in cell wall biosynthesis